jgi:hypothetical protein
MTDGQFADIWDYDNQHLITLCEGCHEAEEAALANLQKFFYFQVREHLNSSEDFPAVVSVLDILSKKAGRRVNYMDLYDVHGIIKEGILWGK